MKIILLILTTTAVCIAAAGIALLLPKKGQEGSAPQGPLSPDSMVKVAPAGPGRLRMSIPQGDRMPLEVMLQVAEVRDDSDIEKLRNPFLPPGEKQEIVDRLRSLGYEIAYDPIPNGKVTEPSGAPVLGSIEEEEPFPDSGECDVDPITLRSQKAFQPVDPSIVKTELDDFYIYEQEQAVQPPQEAVSPEEPAGAVTVRDVRHGGRQDLVWDRLDMD